MPSLAPREVLLRMDLMRRRSQHPTPTRRRADTCCHPAMPVYGGRTAAVRRPNRGCGERAARAARHDVTGTHGTGVWHQGACSLSGKKPQLDRQCCASWRPPMAEGARGRPENETPPPRGSDDALAKRPTGRVRARERVSAGVDGQRPRAVRSLPPQGAPSSGSDIHLGLCTCVSTRRWPP